MSIFFYLSNTFSSKNSHCPFIGYAYGQGISEAVLAGMGAAGALIGVIATLVYPKLRLKIGVERTGLIGFCAEVSCLVLCVISVWAPGSPFNPNVLKTSSISIPSENATIGNATSEVGKGKPEVKRDYTSVILLMAGIAFARFGSH